MALTPRLEVTPMSEEDAAIYVRLCADPARTAKRRYTFARAIRIYQQSDRTDAALMWSMVGAAAALEATTHDRRNLLAFYFGDPFPFCRLLE